MFYIFLFFSLINKNPCKFNWEGVPKAQQVTKSYKQETFFSPNDIEEMQANIVQKSLLPENLYIIGHRGMGELNILAQGLGNEITENTLGAFKQAILSGADGIEFDVWISKDGYPVIIHDDELWKNVYGVDRGGLKLPTNETRDTFRVSQKSLLSLSVLSVGPGKQKIPSLLEVFNLVEEANAIRNLAGNKPIILNIDFKDLHAALRCFDFIENRLEQKTSSTIDFSSVYFTSYNDQALIKLYNKAIARNKHINIVLQLTTQQIFGSDNTDDKYIVKNPETYNKNYLESLTVSVPSNNFVGIDCILWDINLPLLLLCKNQKLQLHSYASNLKKFPNHKAFTALLYYISQHIPIYLKADQVQETILMLKHNITNDTTCMSLENGQFSYKLPFKKPLSH